MVSILDNKKIAELVIKQDANNYEKINPETLATIVEDVTKTESGGVDATVQQHIDDKSIHLSSDDIKELTADNLKVENVKAGSNIIITQEEGTNNITISAGDIPTERFLTGDDIIPEDTTITITPIEDTNKINIRANIPDVSKFVKQENIRAGNDKIIVEHDPESNDVTIYGTSAMYKAGNGIKITDEMEIVNTLPDRLITLNEGSNITIEGEYPNFTISSTDKIKISDWGTNIKYQVDDFCVYNNSLFKCIEEHTSDEVFDPSKWQLIAGWSSKRQIFDIETESNQIVLTETVPNKDALIINIGGILQQSQNYELEPDGKTITFINPIPANSLVEVLVMSNVVLDTYDNKVNIEDWKPHISFAEGNICIYDNSIYQCINRHISSDIFEKENWKLICGYVKNSYFFNSDEETTEITLPESVYKVSDILVNVGNTLLQSNNYTLNESGNIITFNEPIEAGADIEVIVFGNAVLQHNDVPNPVNRPNRFLVSNPNGTGYDLSEKDNSLSLLGLTTLTTFENNGGKIVSVKKDESDFEMITSYKLSSDVKVRDIPNGYLVSIIEGTKEIEHEGMSKTKDDKLQFEIGSILSNDKTVMLHNDSMLIKNPNKLFERGNENGCMIGYTEDDWTQPVMTSNTTPYGTVSTSEAQTDREGYRAMDGLQGSGNGWLANNTTATWQYKLPYEIIVKSIDFYNQSSGVNNHSKDIDIWIDSADNVVASFTALDEDYGHSHVEIPNPVAGYTVGLTIKNSYGQTVGANEIKINATYKDFLTKNCDYYIYAIGNEDGTLNDIATSPYNEEEIANNLPTSYTKFALIGTFNTDENWNIKNIYPNKDITKSFLNGSLNGEIGDNYIKQTLYNNVTFKPVEIIEQWGESVPVEGAIKFTKPYKKLLYVMANGVKILTKDNNGFTVSPTEESISWIAKGY